VKKKDSPSNFTTYFLKGEQAYKDGLTVLAMPSEISKSDSYSEYLSRAWRAGWLLGKAQEKRETAEKQS
jgi:hypothetical protein